MDDSASRPTDPATGRDGEPARRPGRRPGMTIGRVLGVPVYVRPSLVLLAILVMFLYGGLVQETLDLRPATGYLVGLGFVACLLGSVLLHELGHALTARRYSIGVRGITLELLGGYTEMDRDAPSPRVDALVSLAGPAVSLVLGLVAAVVTLALPDRTLLDQLAFQLALSNLVVAVFNLLPGLPLDGGRALRAAVWAVSQDRHRGTEVAGWCGRAVAVGTTLLAALLAWFGLVGSFFLIFTALVAVSLWQGAGQAIQLARISRRFPLIDLRRLVRPVFAVPTGTPLAEAQRRAAETGPAGGALGVSDPTGRLVGLVHPAAAEAVPPQRRAWVAVETVARGVAGIHSLPIDLHGEAVIRAVQAHPGAEYLVTAGQDVVGVLHTSDLAQLLEGKR